MTTAAHEVRSREASHLAGMFLATAARIPDATAARFFEDGGWHTLTWRELEARARRLAAGLVALDVAPGERVALLGESTLDWVVCELAAHMAGAVSVPIYQTSSPPEVAYVLADSGAVVLFVDSDAQLEKVRQVRGEVPALRRAVRMTGAADEDFVTSTDALATFGAGFEEDVEARIAGTRPEDPACFIYTSGTTGPPKGVVLTHANWVYEAEAAAKLNLVNEEDTGFLFLPLAHAFAQVLKVGWFHLGYVGAFARSLDTLVPDMRVLRPTMMAGVPRIYEKAYTRIVSTGMAAPGLQGRLFRWAMDEFERFADAKIAGREYGGISFALARTLVFSKIAKKVHEAFGGRMRLMISAGAPLAPKIAWFFHLAGLEILEGYGLTETSAGAVINRPGQARFGTVGVPLPGTEVRVAEDGEILLKGPNIMRGYHGKPEATAEVLEADGWFHSGDIGILDDAGFLKITDRKKDIIVTAGGKNVAPQNLENTLKTHPLISQVMVHGDKRKFLTALVTLDAEALEGWAKERGLQGGTHAERVRLPEVRAEIQAAVDRMNAGLASYESLKRFEILEDDFTQEGGELTPTLKVRRRVVEKRYAPLLDGFYDEKFD